MRPFPGLFVAAFLLVCSTPPVPTHSVPRAAVSLGNGTLGDVFDQVEAQTGWNIARECACGALTEAVNGPTTLYIRELRADAVIQLALAGWDHCGGWMFVDGRVYFWCGRPPSRLD